VHGVEMVYAGDLWQGLDNDFGFSDVRASELLVNNRQVLADCVFDAFWSFLFCSGEA
jgi:hypothetical protein